MCELGCTTAVCASWFDKASVCSRMRSDVKMVVVIGDNAPERMRSRGVDGGIVEDWGTPGWWP